ncbi:hypothetical protein OE749_08325 [Aestuariibacter sp. AA17]|uniref:Phage protein n=1 Tax=Fluctibacter corallii TaxID=2984329 RepID=A0ABT3A7P1_9ALTE|nr:hypothetical protein [Aestuariibacter sp. AA17]MCV2884700.1 hypothetical protein [Aestuariibacter sp. AA17]
MSEFDSRLINAISKALFVSEKKSDLVITTAVVEDVAKNIAEHIKKEYAGGTLSPEEIFGVAALIRHAVENKEFFDWEMPTLCGYTADEFVKIAERLRKSTSI